MATSPLHRRQILSLLPAAWSAALTACSSGPEPRPSAPRPASSGSSSAKPTSEADSAFTEAITALEQRTGGRLGVCVLDASGAHVGHREGERFGMCSTFKLPLAAVILERIDKGVLRADQPVSFSQKDMVPHAPVTEKHLAEGAMSVLSLAEAAQTTSDNVAANLLLRLIGGPAGFVEALRALGDGETRLDRWEPEMNLVPPGDERDTTTPLAMARTVARVLSPGVLSASSRALLVQWMVATTTGKKRIRAGLPADFAAGDKTGTGMAPGITDMYNDVAAVWRGSDTSRIPDVISVYFNTGTTHEDMRDEDQAVLADAGRLAASWLVARASL